jgi:dimethylamine/trimethylamine dehydrogenase
VSRDPKYDILFEPVEIGPKTMRNRFYQTPHCTGLGSQYPGAQAHFRGMKAEGGWAVVNTEYCSIHPENDDAPWSPAKLWDDTDVRNLGLMCEKIHEHGSLAGVELHYAGPHTTGYESRLPPRGVSQMPSESLYMSNCYAMDREEMVELLEFYLAAVRRARAAGFDIINLHAAECATVPLHFLMKYFNRRTDEYGTQSMPNRARFFRELTERVREEIGDELALTIRLQVDNLRGDDLGIRVEEEGVGFIEYMDELVDFWDLQVGGPIVMEWTDNAGASRFFPENFQGWAVSKVRPYTKKPIVGVGRFTNPDTMVEVIRSGQIDIIGAARPSISDPFLPKKIEEGRFDDIRECIGCNMCASRYNQGARIVCTQNATSGEEYRRGWHPEKFDPARNAGKDVLVVGAGAAGLECAMVLGKRGMRRVHLVEAQDDMGGIMRWVPQLPGLGEWARVVNYRRIQIDKLPNVEFIPSTRLTAQDVRTYGAEIVVIATGSHWATDGLNPQTRGPIPGVDASLDWCLTPEQIMVAGKPVPGERVVVYDTEGYFAGVGLVERLLGESKRVTYVTPFAHASPYTFQTGEAYRLNRRFRQEGVRILLGHLVTNAAPGRLTLIHGFAPDEPIELEADSLVLTTQRLSDDALYRQLKSDRAALEAEGVEGLYRIGDCVMPRMALADAIFDGHRLAREIDCDDPAAAKPYIRENRVIGATDQEYDGVLELGPANTYVPRSTPQSALVAGP